MAVVTPTPLDPAFATQAVIATPCSAYTFATGVNTYVGGTEDMAQLAQAHAEKLHNAIGYCWLSGGAITAGVGLSVSVAALTAFCGGWIETNAAITVGGLTALSTNYIWLRQDGTFGSNITGVAPSGDTHGAALLWGTATTDAGAVTAVDNERVCWYPEQVLDVIPSAASYVISQYRQYNVEDTLTVYGALTVTGSSRVIGLAANAYWDDLMFPAAGINPAGAAAPPGVDTADGTLVFDAGGTEVIAIQVQLPHSWVEGSDIYPHVHWTGTNTGLGNVLWRLQYDWANIDGAFAGSFTTVDALGAAKGSANFHILTPFAAISGAGKTRSSMIKILLSRIGGDGTDTYGADARFLQFDIHIQKDKFGSRAEAII